MENLIVSLVLSHQQLIEGAVIGFAFGHVPQIVAFAFHQAMRIPMLRAAVLKDPAKAKALVDSIQQELDKDIDAESAAAPPPESHQ